MDTVVTRNVSNMDDAHDEDEHLADIEDGCGCAEVWEHLSAQRADD